MTRTNPTDRTDRTGQTITAAPVVPGDLFSRHQTITGLRALADFLEANPGVPVKEYGQDILVPIRAGDDASAAALVDQAAALLGVEVADERDNGGHYIATRTFGRISYSVFYVPDLRRRDYRALDSYRGNIRLDTDQDHDHHDGEQDGGQDTGRAA